MSKNVPTNKALYAKVKAEAKKKFDAWPSAYGSAWLVKTYKKRGGTYTKAEEGMEVPDYGYGGGMNYADYAYMYGGEDTDMEEYAKGGGIPERYKNKGFTKVGAKKKSTRPGKKWMVLAKKGDKYKIVHGGDSNMKDFKQHGSAERKKRFWDRMGGRNGSKAKDPFSPLYWHKRFGTWAEGGQFEPHMMYNPETGEGFMANKMQDHLEMKEMGYLHKDEMRAGGEYFNEDSMDFYSQGGGTNNPGFRSLPPEVQQNILDNMGIGGECYACGGQKKYQMGSEFLPYPDDTGDLPVMYPNPNENAFGDPTVMLDQVDVTAPRIGGITPRPIPDMTPEMPSLNLMPVTLPERLDYLPYPDDTGGLPVMYADYTKGSGNSVEPSTEGSLQLMNDSSQFQEQKKIEDPQQEQKKKEDAEQEQKKKAGKKAPMDPKLQWALGRIAIANQANQFMENIDDRKQEAKMRRNLLTDNFVPMEVGNDRGEYDINSGVFMPDQYTSVQYQSQMAQGGQIGMVDEDILKELIAAGADIEILD